VLGEIDDPGMEIEIAVRKYEVPHLFSAETLAQAAALPDKIRPTDRKGRIDLTDVPLVTIDGEDARDFDDAVYCEPARIGRVTAEGELHAYQFYPAVICSHARFTYTEVAAILANTRGPEAVKRQELVPDLLNLHEVYRALLKERTRRGAIDFETTETQIVCD